MMGALPSGAGRAVNVNRAIADHAESAGLASVSPVIVGREAKAIPVSVDREAPMTDSSAWIGAAGASLVCAFSQPRGQPMIAGRVPTLLS